MTTALDLSAAPGSAAQRPGGAVAAVLTLTWASLVSFVREPMAFVMGLLYPLFMLILFNAVFPGEMNGGITFGEYMLPAWRARTSGVPYSTTRPPMMMATSSARWAASSR